MKLLQMKSDFVSNVSHELRTPLSSIRVFGELLKLGRVTDTESVREFGAYIETECRRLTGLINNILDFSHIESGRKEYQFAPTDLRALIAETVKAYEVRLKHEGFELRLATTPTPLVAVDAEAIAQAFVNLLDNAAKYSGSARVIEVRVQSQGEAVTISCDRSRHRHCAGRAGQNLREVLSRQHGLRSRCQRQWLGVVHRMPHCRSPSRPGDGRK